MDELTETMGQQIAQRHIARMASVVGNERLTRQLTSEPAGADGQLPAAQQTAIAEELVKRFGKTKADEVLQLADVFKRRVAFGVTYFDDAAMASFGKKYDQLNDAERLVLHGGDEVAESFTTKSFKALGVALSGYAVYSAYQQASKHGTAVALASGGARALIEVVQAGVPILAAIELVAVLTAGAVELGANAYKNAVLEDLYESTSGIPVMAWHFCPTFKA